MRTSSRVITYILGRIRDISGHIWAILSSRVMYEDMLGTCQVTHMGHSILAWQERQAKQERSKAEKERRVALQASGGGGGGGGGGSGEPSVSAADKFPVGSIGNPAPSA